MSKVRIEHPDAICLRCRRPFQPDHQVRTADDCRCRVPVPSTNGETPVDVHEGTDFREIELMAATGRRCASWCPAVKSLAFGCWCDYGRLELSDPRPEVVEAAVERYRAAHPDPEPEPRPSAWRRLVRALGGRS